MECKQGIQHQILTHILCVCFNGRKVKRTFEKNNQNGFRIV